MHFNYSVTKDLYLKLLLKKLKEKESAPFRLLCFFVLTVGQSAWVIYMLCTAELSSNGRIFMILWSVALSAINIIFRATRKKRAQISLNNLISTENISSDYWKIHSLTVDEEIAKLRFGKTVLECPCAELDVAEDTDMLYLSSHGKVFDIVPSDYAEKEALMKALSSTKDNETDELLGDIDSCDEVFRFSFTGKEFVSSQVRAYQQYFLNNTLKSPRYLFKMALCAFLVWYMIISEPGIRTVLSAALIIFWNFPAILCITPITKKYLYSRISALSWVGENDGCETVACRKGNCIVFSMGSLKWSALPDKSSCVYSTKKGITLFTGTWPAVFIPAAMFENDFRRDEYAAVLRCLG